ncbi:MAG: MFS transporter [Candidatus Paceibacterota bacterium]
MSPAETTTETKSGRMKKWTYRAQFFLALNLGLILYVNSSFLAGHIDAKYVGLVFSIAATLAIFTLFKLPDFIERYGNAHLIAALGFISIIIIPILVTIEQSALVIGLFVLYFIIVLMIRYSLDLYLEHISDDATTGATRGIFLVIYNAGILLAILLAGLILGQGDDYQRVYFAGAIALLPLMAIASIKLEEVRSEYIKPPALKMLKKIMLAKEDWEKRIHKILAIDFLLNFFYIIMIVYTPIYLHQFIGLSWKEIGIVFALMHIPFMLLPIPLGRLADSKFGEKEFLSLGLLTIGLTTISISFIQTPSLLIWSLVLIGTRVGASVIEGMKEAYLFKNIGPGDVGVLSVSRNTVPLAYIIGPLVASSFLIIFDFRFLFAFIGLVMLFGLRYSLTLVDTK